MRRNWIKLYVDQCLRGTMMKELPYNERWLWFGILLLAGDSPFEGKICITENIGYTDEQIAELLETPVDVYKSAKEKMLKHNKIKVDENNVILIVNWTRYQSEYSRLRVYKSRGKKGTKKSTRKGTKKNTNSSLSISPSNSSSTSKEIKDKYKEIRHEVIKYLNEKTGKNFDIDSDSVIALINGRLNDKKPTNLEELKFVIDVKASQWLNDTENNKYLRPDTLFRKSNFENYRNEILPKRRPQVGENIQESKPSEDSYWKDRVIKSAEINKELADEVEEAKKAGNIHRLEGLEKIKKEKIAEWSQARQKKIQAI